VPCHEVFFNACFPTNRSSVLTSNRNQQRDDRSLRQPLNKFPSVTKKEALDLFKISFVDLTIHNSNHESI